MYTSFLIQIIKTVFSFNFFTMIKHNGVQNNCPHPTLLLLGHNVNRLSPSLFSQDLLWPRPSSPQTETIFLFVPGDAKRPNFAKRMY